MISRSYDVNGCGVNGCGVNGYGIKGCGINGYGVNVWDWGLNMPFSCWSVNCNNIIPVTHKMCWETFLHIVSNKLYMYYIIFR